MFSKSKNIFLLGGLFILSAVMLGAFGAHGLKKILDITALETFKTGVTYQYYHGFGLLFLGLIGKSLTIDFSKSAIAFTFGIFLFSFNCYIYAVTQIKTIAMIIPVGGLLFMLGWIFFIIKIYKTEIDK